MERSIEREPAERDERMIKALVRDEARVPESEPSRERQVVRDRNDVWRVSEADMVTLVEIGRFRTVALQDLLVHRYRGRICQLRDDVSSLAAQGLVQQRTAPVRRGRLEVVVLTPAGKRLLERNLPAGGQAVYAGFVKRSEVAHDAAIYRMFQAERRRIEREGGSVRRLVLDYELKRLAYAPLARAKPRLAPGDFAKRQATVAQEFGLSIVDGRLVLPDLRIEYLTREATLARVDLELATEHYHASHLAAKAQAGFRFYVADGSANRLSRVLEEREITVSILSL
jgi:hypothetical protein